MAGLAVFLSEPIESKQRESFFMSKIIFKGNNLLLQASDVCEEKMGSDGGRVFEVFFC